VLVPVALKRELGVSDDTTFHHEGREVAPTGVNVVGDGGDGSVLFREPRLAVNVNTLADARIARRRL
jgi:adenosylcobinamide-phosphate guanylyltransferase